MKTGDVAALVMKKKLCAGGELDEKRYLCEVLSYDAKKKSIFLVVEKYMLQEFSLDAIYDCTIKEDENIISCTGRIRERYCDQHGKVLKIEINNGFYKINVKSVDK